MKNKHSIIIAGILAVIGFIALAKGFMIMFIGSLLVSGMIIGGQKAAELIQAQEEGKERDLKKSSFINAVIGFSFIIGGAFIPGIIGLVLSFVGGSFVGLIFVNAMFDKK